MQLRPERRVRVSSDRLARHVGTRLLGRSDYRQAAEIRGCKVVGHKVHLTTCASGSGAMSSAAVGRLRGARDLSDDSADTAEEIIPPLEKSSIPPTQLLHEWWCVFCP